MSLRAEMVMKAKQQGICTQCMKNKPAPTRLQCQRCIDTNKRKRDKRKAKYDEYQAKSYDRYNLNNKYRMKINKYAHSVGICAKCFGRPVTGDLRQCDICLERKRRWQKTKRKVETRKVPTKQQEYKHKALVKKVRKLDQIRYAVEKGRSI